MIYFRHYIEDFDDATAELSMLEDCAYCRLLRYYFRKEKPLPLNSDSLARICRAISLEERAAIAAVLDLYFDRRADGWHNERADHEIKVSQIARENGSRGGRPVAEETDIVTGIETEHETGDRTERKADDVTGGEAGSGQPISLLSFQPSNLSPLYPNTSAEAAPRGRKPPVDTSHVWASYSQAYHMRYSIDPVRNARVNGQLASVVRSVGKDEAPHVAAFYVGHNRAQYVAAKHSTSLLARDAEGLRTEWATDRKVTETQAHQADRTQATGNVFAKMLEELAEEERGRLQ